MQDVRTNPQLYTLAVIGNDFRIQLLELCKAALELGRAHKDPKSIIHLRTNSWRIEQNSASFYCRIWRYRKDGLAEEMYTAVPMLGGGVNCDHQLNSYMLNAIINELVEFIYV